MFKYLPFSHLFTLHTVSKEINQALQGPSLWKGVVELHWQDQKHLNGGINNIVEMALDCEKWEEDEAPLYSGTGLVSVGQKPSKELPQLPSSQYKVIVQSWAIIGLWEKAFCPLFYPDLSANGEPEFDSFFVVPGAGKDFWSEFTENLKEECSWGATDPDTYEIDQFYDTAMEKIEEIVQEKAQEEEEGEPDFCNFPKGSIAKWKNLPNFLWKDKKWPFTKYLAGEIGPWENLYRFFWGVREDNSVVGFCTIIDNS